MALLPAPTLSTHSLPGTLLPLSGPPRPPLDGPPRVDLRGPPSAWGPYFGHHIAKCKQTNIPHNHLGISPALKCHSPQHSPLGQAKEMFSGPLFQRHWLSPTISSYGLCLPALDLFTLASRPCPRSGEEPACKKRRSRSLALSWQCQWMYFGHEKFGANFQGSNNEL